MSGWDHGNEAWLGSASIALNPALVIIMLSSTKKKKFEFVYSDVLSILNLSGFTAKQAVTYCISVCIPVKALVIAGCFVYLVLTQGFSNLTHC